MRGSSAGPSFYSVRKAFLALSKSRSRRKSHVRLGSKADLAALNHDVRFVPKADVFAMICGANQPVDEIRGLPALALLPLLS